MTIDTTNSGTTRLSASEKVRGLEVQIDTGALSLEGAQVVDSTFEFAQGANATFLSTAEKMSGTTIVMLKGSDSVQIDRGIVRKSSISTGRGGDAVLLESSALIKGNSLFDLGKGKDEVTVDAEIRKATFDLGQGADQISITGNVKKAFVDLGDDKAGDVITIASTDLISKRIKLSNFDKKDELVIGDETFSYKDLQSDNPDRIKVSFRGETSAIVPEESTDSSASAGFDFL